jgi:hypothetical protein
MTPKEKAKELFDKYVELSGIFIGDYESEKEMCLILVDEVLKETEERDGMRVINNPYWLEVRNEIEKL